MVLALLGFAATDFMITMTLSAADASAHLTHNPFAPEFLHGQELVITLALLAGLGIVFLRGFSEAIKVAVLLVAAFLALNLVVVLVSLLHVFASPVLVGDWWTALNQQHGNPVMMIALAVLVFPKLAWACPASRPASPSCRRSAAHKATPRRTPPAASAAPISS